MQPAKDDRSNQPRRDPATGALVDIRPGRISLNAVSDDGLTLTIHLRCNVEQSLHHLDVEENHDQVLLSAWYGWRPDAVHVRIPSAVAAGKSAWPRDIRLMTPLGNRSVIDGGTGETQSPSRARSHPSSKGCSKQGEISADDATRRRPMSELVSAAARVSADR